MIRENHSQFAVGIAATILLFFSASAAFTQAIAVANVNGQVTDPTGSGVAGATVRMVETDKQLTRTTTTDGRGRFSLPLSRSGPDPG